MIPPNVRYKREEDRDMLHEYRVTDDSPKTLTRKKVKRHYRRE